MKIKYMLFLAGIVSVGITAQAQYSWDITPGTVGAGDSAITTGNGTWDTVNGNWTSDGGVNNTNWINGSDAHFDISSGYKVTIGSGAAITVNNLTMGSNNQTLTLEAATDNEGITVASGNQTWDLGGNTLKFQGNQANDTKLTKASGTLTVQNGNLNAGEKQNGADWAVGGANLNFQGSTLRGNANNIGQFSSVTLGAGSSYIHERNQTQTYNNNWVLDGGTVSFDNRYNSRGMTINGTISGNADDFRVNLTDSTATLILKNTAAYTANTTTIEEGKVRLDADNAIANTSVLQIGNADGGGSSLLNLNGSDLTVAGLQGLGNNTRKISVDNAALSSVLTINVSGTNSYNYGSNFDGAGSISIVKEGTGTQSFDKDTHTKAISSITVNNGLLVWDTSNGGSVNVGVNGALGGSGGFTGAATIAGALNPGNSPGTMTFNDALTLESTATLTLELLGTGIGEFDVLANDGGDTLTAGGDLVFDTTGYVASVGDSFLVFSNWNGISGSFSSISGTDLGGGLSLDTSNLLIDGTVSVIPEPTTLGLVAAMGGSLIWIRRRLMI